MRSHVVYVFLCTCYNHLGVFRYLFSWLVSIEVRVVYTVLSVQVLHISYCKMHLDSGVLCCISIVYYIVLYDTREKSSAGELGKAKKGVYKICLTNFRIQTSHTTLPSSHHSTSKLSSFSKKIHILSAQIFTRHILDVH